MTRAATPPPGRWPAGATDQYRPALLRSDNAARNIQRIFRGNRVRSDLPNVRMFQKRNLNAGHHIPATTANLMEFWSQEAPQKERIVSFSIDGIVRDGRGDHVMETTLVDREDKPSFIFAKIIDAAFSLKPIFPHVRGDADTTKKIDELFQESIGQISQGNTYDLWDGRSTKIPGNPACCTKVMSAYVKFGFFAESPARILSRTTCCKVREIIQKQTVAFLDKQFDELTLTEIAAANRLGYKDQQTWDNRFGR